MPFSLIKPPFMFQGGSYMIFPNFKWIPFHVSVHDINVFPDPLYITFVTSLTSFNTERYGYHAQAKEMYIFQAHCWISWAFNQAGQLNVPDTHGHSLFLTQPLTLSLKLRFFTGFSNVYRCFVPHSIKFSYPLNSLSQKAFRQKIRLVEESTKSFWTLGHKIGS